MGCRTSIEKTLGLLAMGIGLLGGCYLCLVLDFGIIARVAGWAGLLLFGASMAVGTSRILRPGIRVVINENGIEDRRLRIGVVPWEEVTAIELRTLKSVRTLCVEVNDERKYVERMPTWVRVNAWAGGLFGYPPISINFVGLDPSIEDVWEYIWTHHPPPTAPDGSLED